MNKVLENNFIPLLLITLVICYFYPGLSDLLMPYVNFLLALTIFLMGLNLEIDEVCKVIRKPLPVIIGICVLYLFMPFLAFAFAKIFALPTEFAIGLLLVGTAPGGVASNIFVYLAGADLPLSIGMTTVSTFLTPIMLPSLILFYARSWVAVDFWSLVLSTVQVVLLPVLLGILFHKFFPKLSRQLSSVTPSLAIISVTLIVATMFDLNHQKLTSFNMETLTWINVTKMLLAIILHNIFGWLAGYYFPRFWIKNPKQLRAITIEVGLQNAGLAMVLATAHFMPLAAVPCMFAAIWHLLSASFIAKYWKANPN